MTAEEFSAALRELGLPQRQFAIRAGISPETVNRWARGHAELPEWAAWVIELLLREHRRRRPRR